MSKRKAEDLSDSSRNPQRIGPSSSQEQMDIMLLKFQNKKLTECIDRRIRTETVLLDQIEKLEKRQKQNDTILTVVNRYWNQLNEDVCVLLQSFDAQSAGELQVKKEDAENTSFLDQLSSWDRSSIDENLTHRLLISKRAVSKIFQVIGRVLQRNENIALAFKGGVCAKPTAPSTADGEEGTESNCDIVPTIEEVLQQAHIEIMTENRNLHDINTSLREKFQTMSLKMNHYKDTLSAKVTENDELKHQIDNLQFDLDKSHCRIYKLENKLDESIQNLKTYQQANDDLTKANAFMATASSSDDVSSRLVKELQFNDELDKLHTEVGKLKMQLNHLPKSVIIETPVYKCLQSQFSVLYNESMEVKKLLDETRQQLQTSKDHQMSQTEESNGEKMMCTEIIEMKHMLAQARTEYENMRIQFEHTKTDKEKIAIINRESFLICETLRSEIDQLNGEVQRLKYKTYKDTSTLRKELFEYMTKLGASNQLMMSGDGLKTKSIDARVAEMCVVGAADESDKDVSGDRNDKIELLDMTKKLSFEVDELLKELQKLQEIPRDECKQLCDHAAVHQIKQQNNELQKLFANLRDYFLDSYEEVELLKQMEETRKAFLVMEEQNVRLIQQLHNSS